MKKVYEAPELEVELYTLDESIASNCTLIVESGPEMPGHSGCEGYVEPFALFRSVEEEINMNFYDEVICDCYTTGNGSGLWTS